MKEEHLLAGLRAGRQEAILTWYRLFAPKLQRFILSKLSSKSDAEEITQDTFISCLESLPLFQAKSSLWTWMCSVAQHEIADYFRKKYAKRVLQSLPFIEGLLPTHLHNMHEVSSNVQHVLSRMTSQDREVLLMKYIDKLRVQEIAEKLQVSFKSVESLLFRARKTFRALYAEEQTI